MIWYWHKLWNIDGIVLRARSHVRAFAFYILCWMRFGIRHRLESCDCKFLDFWGNIHVELSLPQNLMVLVWQHWYFLSLLPVDNSIDKDLMSQYGPYTNYDGTNDGGTVFLLETPYCKDFRDASAAMESPAYHDARCLHKLNILILYLTFCAFAKNIPSKKR